jgi:predicted small lipoprotein YifL
MLVRKIVLALMVLTLAVSLEACGRKNAPVAPDDVDPKYPRTYPAPQKVPS